MSIVSAPRAGRLYRELPHLNSVSKKKFASYVVGNSLALLLGLTVAYVSLLSNHSITTDTIKTGDFIAYYAGAHMVATGHGSHLYNFIALGRLENSLLHPLVVNQAILMPYLCPAFLAILMAPVAAFPYSLAYAVWLVINCLLLSIAMFALESYSGLTGRAATIARFAFVASLPVLLTLFNGQTSILLLAFLTLCFFALRSGRHWLAGVALALSAFKLPYVLPILLLLLVAKKWQVIASFCSALLLLLATPLVFLGSSVNQGYLQTLLKAASWHGEYGFAPSRNDSLAGFFQLLLPSGQSNLARLAVTTVILGAVVFCTWASRCIDLPFGLSVIAALLVSPHALTHDLVLLAIPVAVLLANRQHFHSFLPLFLGLGYILLPVGYFLVYPTRVQLPTLLMLALAFLIFKTALNPARYAAEGRGIRQVDLQPELAS